MIKKKTTEQKWLELSEATKAEAAKLPCGKPKENCCKGPVSYGPLPR